MNVLLRELERSDLPTLNAWRRDRELVGRLGSAHRFVGPDVDEAWFDGYLASRTNNVRTAICDAVSSRIVGVVYLLSIDWTHRHGEFAILLGDEQVRGKGVGEIATRHMLRHAFKDLNLHRVYLSVLADNAAARALYRKVGFVEEGIARDALFKNGDYADLVTMAILSHEFEPNDTP